MVEALVPGAWVKWFRKSRPTKNPATCLQVAGSKFYPAGAVQVNLPFPFGNGGRPSRERLTSNQGMSSSLVTQPPWVFEVSVRGPHLNLEHRRVKLESRRWSVVGKHWFPAQRSTNGSVSKNY